MARVPPDIPGISGWQPLARGGFATVWQARQDTLDRPVAVKVDERTLDSDAERRRFLGEARAAGNLSGHPGIVTVHDAGILADGRPYLVMKLCPEGSLTSWLRPEARQSPERIRAVGVRIADALAAAHSQGMLHRDVKPANILIDSYGNAGLADFGLAAGPEPGSAAELTPAYAPPESFRGEPPSEFGDVYQLAATLYALLAGRPPRDPVGGRRSLEELVERLDDPVPDVPEVDHQLMRVVLDGLAGRPENRPTAAEFRDRLAGVELSDGPSTVLSGATAVRPPARRRRRLVIGLVAATLGFLLVAVLGSGVFYLYEIDRSVTANIGRGLELPREGPGEAKRPAKQAQAKGALNYVLIGDDGGDPELDRDGRSDAFMLVHLNQASDEAYIISFPRDTYVDIPGQGKGRLNAAYANGGEALVVRTLEKLTGTRMDHVAKIDFQGFVNLTQDLDGVTVTNPIPFRSKGHYFPAGEVTLVGDSALAFVRERDALPSELVRAENQRNVLKAILSKGLSAEVIADPLRFTRFVGNAAKRIQVDNDLSDGELRSTALALRLRPSNIKMLSVPLEKQRRVDEQLVQPVNRKKLAKLGEALRNDTMADYVQGR